MSSFTKELTELINKYSIENNSDTPDWILVKYIDNCLNAWELSFRQRDSWYGFKPFDFSKEVIRPLPTDVENNQPGICPKCGIDLTKTDGYACFWVNCPSFLNPSC